MIKTYKIIIPALIVVWMFMGSTCSKTNPPTPTRDLNDFGKDSGQIEFWSEAHNVVYPIVFNFKNSNNVKVHSFNVNQIDSLFFDSDHAPVCSTILGGLPLRGPAGHYTFTANDQAGTSWSGDVDITAGACHTKGLNGSYAIALGDWQRMSNGVQGNTAGAIIHWDGTKGVVTSNPNGTSCWNIGKAVWGNNDAVNGTLYYWETNPDCSGGLYISGKLKFDYVGSQNRITIDDIQYVRQ